MSDPPPGYLGAEARITQGPAPELVAAGYELELADAELLHTGFTLADLAHVLALATIPEHDRRTLLDALLHLELEIPDARYGDLANVREKLLQDRVGAPAGWLNAGRPRREAGRIAFRIALRARLLELHAAVTRFEHALAAQATAHRDTLMPDYTYLQAAQPTTVGHWLLSHAYPVSRDADRVARDFDAANRSPAGAGGVNGSRFPLDRHKLAELLGFDGLIEHTRDANWQTDTLAEATFHAALAATTASRFAEDLELYGADEFGLLRIGDAFCRASALMPQKRNPYALVVIRGAAGTLLGRATGVLATQRTPSGRTDNLLYAYGEIANAIETATKAIDLAAAVTESLSFTEATIPSSAMAADAAELISLQEGVDYRTAYKRIGAGEGLTLDPREAIQTRTVPGGAAPAPMDAMLAQLTAHTDAAREWAAAKRAAVTAAEQALRQSAGSRSNVS
jgi:argininosuccinate lyase